MLKKKQLRNSRDEDVFFNLWSKVERRQSFAWYHSYEMVRFNKKESESRKELLDSMNQVNDAQENENGKGAAMWN